MEVDRLLRKLAYSRDLAPFRALLDPLAEHDLRKRSDLVRTLRMYFATGANASEAADRLFLHRNSAIYRLERIQKLTGLELKNPDASLALQLGLLAMEKGETDADQHP